MAYVTVNVVDLCSLPIEKCEIIWLCLDESWMSKTKSGLPFAEARVTAVYQYVEPNAAPLPNPCGTFCPTTPPICRCIYQLEINDAQFNQDPITARPYKITSEDIHEMLEHECFVANLTNYLSLQEDHVLDYPNVTATPDQANNEWDLYYPVVDRKSGDAVGNKTINIEAASLSGDNATNVLTLASGTGALFNVDVADLIETAFDGVTITRTGAGDTYEANFAGISYPTGMAEVRYPSDMNFGVAPGDPAVSTLFTGDSDITTPAYVQYVFNNPNATRAMKVVIQASTSFASDYISGSGQVVLGHSLWVNGVKIAAINGRSKPGFNISWSDGIGAVQDHTLPIITHVHTIPAGGSVTVGLDFGDNDVFASAGTLTVVSLESRIISVSGHTI